MRIFYDIIKKSRFIENMILYIKNLVIGSIIMGITVGSLYLFRYVFHLINPMIWFYAVVILFICPLIGMLVNLWYPWYHKK